MERNRKIKNSLNCVFWNANSLQNKLTEFQNYLMESEIDVALISETHFKSNKVIKIPNYNVYRRDRDNNRGGGVAIFVKQNIHHHLLPNADSNRIEVIGIEIITTEGKVNLFSIYIPPGDDLIFEELDKIFIDNTSPCIVAGDFNAKNTIWKCNLTNLRGKKLLDYTDQRKFTVVAPDEPTHLHSANNTKDILDIALIRNIKWQIELNVEIKLSSDHLPVLMNIQLNHALATRIIPLTDWRKFKEKITVKPINIKTKDDLEEAVSKLEESFTTAMKEATILKPININYSKLPYNIKNKIKEKNKLKKKYYQTLDPADKRNLNRATLEAQTEIKNFENEKWLEQTEKMNEEDKPLWNIIKILTKKKKTGEIIPALQNDEGKIATTDEEKIEMFADNLEIQFKTHQIYHPETERIVGNNKTCGHPSINTDPPKEATLEEIMDIIKELKNRKAPGNDQITNEYIKNCPPIVINEIRKIANGIMVLNYFPSRWKTAKTIMIKKAGKPSKNPSSYRPISLLSSISKIVEKVIFNRLKDILDNENIIPNHQCGFRTNHSTSHQLLRITECIIKGFNKSKETGMVCLDIEKAFDKVWHNGLLFKMSRLNLPNWLIKTIDSYLTNRKFQVAVGNKLSTKRIIEAGVPQGSILSPILFNIYISDIPKLNFSSIAQFADDTAIYTQSRIQSKIVKNLEYDLKTLHNWCTKWKIKINSEKTTAILFKKKRKCYPKCISFENVQLKWNKEIKYLGIILDEKLTFKNHINHINCRSRQVLHLIYPLICKKSNLNLDNKIKTIHSTVLPIILYGSEIWNIAKSYHTYKLQIVMNKALRIATDAPWFITNQQLREETKFRDLNSIIEDKTNKLLETSIDHQNSEIQNLFKIKESKSTDSHTGVINKHRSNQ